MSTNLRRVTLPTPGMPRRFDRLRFLSAPADASASGEGGGDDPKGTDGDNSQQGDPADEALGEGGKKALVAERARATKAEADLAALRQEIEDGKKTTEQKAADALAEAQRKAEESAARALRYEVAAAKGLDLKLATRLTGTTKAELEADADALMELLPKKEEPSDDGKPHTPYRDLAKVKGDAPTPSPGMGSLRAAYAESKK